MKKTSTTLTERNLTINESKDTFFSLKMNESTGADKIFFDVIKNCFGEFLRYVFYLSLQTEIFPEPLNIAKVTTVFKTDDIKEMSNYRPISVLPCFLKIWERIMQNHLYSHLVNKKYYIQSLLLPKRWFHRACQWSISWSNSSIIWKRQLHTWDFYWFIQGLWHYQPCSIIEKNLKIMELRVQILPGSDVTWQIGNNTFKSLMMAKAIYEILHVKYHRAPFLDCCFF